MLSIPTVNPYFIVSNIAAIGGGSGLGPKIAMAPMRIPQSAVSATADIKMTLNRSFNMTLSRVLDVETRSLGRQCLKWLISDNNCGQAIRIVSPMPNRHREKGSWGACVHPRNLRPRCAVR